MSYHESHEWDEHNERSKGNLRQRKARSYGSTAMESLTKSKPAKHNALKHKLNPAQSSVKKNLDALKERKGEAPLEKLKRLLK